MNELKKRKGLLQTKGTSSLNGDNQIPEEEDKAPKKSAMEIAQEKYRKFFTRTIWGSLMIMAFALILYTDHTLVCVFVVVLQIIVFKEMIALRYTEAKEKNLWGFRTLHWHFFIQHVLLCLWCTCFVSFE